MRQCDKLLSALRALYRAAEPFLKRTELRVADAYLLATQPNDVLESMIENTRDHWEDIMKCNDAIELPKLKSRIIEIGEKASKVEVDFIWNILHTCVRICAVHLYQTGRMGVDELVKYNIRFK